MTEEAKAIADAVNGLTAALMRNLDISGDVKALLQGQAAQGSTLRDLKQDSKDQLEALFSLRRDDGERLREIETNQVSKESCQTVHEKVDAELGKVRSALDKVTWRVAAICGGLAVVSTIINWVIAARVPAQALGVHP